MLTQSPVLAATPPSGQAVGEWSLRPEVQSARLGRRLVDGVMPDVDDGVRRRAALITSELVANGVRHATGDMVLSVHRLSDGWLLAVADDNPSPPVVRVIEALAEEGRGLMIVQRVSHTLAWAATPGGKVVWACLRDEPNHED